MSFKRHKLIYFLVAIILLESVLWFLKYPWVVDDLVYAKPSVAAYLQRIYPLLKPGLSNQQLFNQLHYFEPPYPKLPNPIYRPNVKRLPQYGDLMCVVWMDCYYASDHKIIGTVYKNEYDPHHINSYQHAKGYPSNSYVEVYHNEWFEEPGHYYYVFKGSGIFLNVGRTLVAPNKVAALSKLGVSNEEILRLGSRFRDRSNRSTQLYVYVKNYAQKKHVLFKQALNAIIMSCIKGDNYANNRIANSDSYDFPLWERGKKSGYDTIQMTVQPNGSGGWAFELLDLRTNINLTLEKQWQNAQAYLSLRNPVDLTVHAPCHYKVPFEKLYCEKP